MNYNILLIFNLLESSNFEMGTTAQPPSQVVCSAAEDLKFILRENRKYAVDPDPLLVQLVAPHEYPAN